MSQKSSEAQDVNQSNIPWRVLQKHLTDHMRKNYSDTLSSDSYAVTGDDMTECSIWDASCQKERSDIVCKKQRKVFREKSITVRLVMRNPLLVAIELSKVRLHCHYPDESEGEQTKQEFDATYADVSSASLTEKTSKDYKIQ